eukprot:3696754-Lingulodinium_polyedra.AAC.1
MPRELGAQRLHLRGLLLKRLFRTRPGTDSFLLELVAQSVQHIMDPMLRPERRDCRAPPGTRIRTTTA